MRLDRGEFLELDKEKLSGWDEEELNELGRVKSEDIERLGREITAIMPPIPDNIIEPLNTLTRVVYIIGVKAGVRLMGRLIDGKLFKGG